MKPFVLLTAVWALAACAPQAPTAPQAVSETGVPAASQPQAASEVWDDPDHSSRNALDWDGIYRGRLPCGSCDGIETELVLRQDGSYRLAEAYLGDDAPRSEVSGRFAWLPDGGRIRLDEAGESRYYLVGENRLWGLDAEGGRLPEETADLYVLEKAAAE